MPWRNLVNDRFETCETTDMSQEKMVELRTQGYKECNLLELQLAQLCRGYGSEAVADTLRKMTSPEAESWDSDTSYASSILT